MTKFVKYSEIQSQWYEIDAKNAVVGKAHRIGLERRPSPIRRTAVKPDRKKARSPIMPTLQFEIKSNEQKEILHNNGTFQPTSRNIFLSKLLIHFPEMDASILPVLFSSLS